MPYASAAELEWLYYFDTKSVEPDRGAGNPPVVMVHGLGSSQNYYMPVIPFLANHRCIALDSRGAGRSGETDEDITISTLAKDVIKLMDHLNIPKAILVGHSMGGPLVLTVAAISPERAAAVVALGPVNPKSVNAGAFEARIDTVIKDGMEPLANSIPNAATNAQSTPLQRAMIRELLSNQNPASYVKHCRAIIHMQEPPGGFAAVKAPVLILAGEEDKSAPMEGCEYIHKHLGSPSKELVVMPAVGHWHSIEAGEQVASQISRFCSSL